MNLVDRFFTKDIKTCAIAGHVGPDGDCVGSTTAMYLYLKKHFQWIDVRLYLEQPKESLMFLPVLKDAIFEEPDEENIDLLVTLDASDPDRIGLAGKLLPIARHTLCIDHHISNPGFAENNIIDAEASSCAEVLFYVMDPEKIDKEIAEALYTGIVHDSGVFQYRNTRPETMEAAAALMRTGIAFSDIVEDSFNTRSFVENRVMGYVLSRCRQYADGKITGGSITSEEMETFGACKKDLDIIVSQLRLTRGSEAAFFVYQTGPDQFKASLRSNHYLDVSEVAGIFGGGGHIRAAGCTLYGTVEAVEQKIVSALTEKLR